MKKLILIGSGFYKVMNSPALLVLHIIAFENYHAFPERTLHSNGVYLGLIKVELFLR